jgi:hypothetical protein
MVSIDFFLTVPTAAPSEDFHSGFKNSSRLPNGGGPTRIPSNCRMSPTPHERRICQFRGCLLVACDMKTGEVFAAANLRSVGPFCALHPRHLPDILDRSAAHDIEKGTPFGWDMADRI